MIVNNQKQARKSTSARLPASAGLQGGGFRAPAALVA
jgi:hypothetical protein